MGSSGSRRLALFLWIVAAVACARVAFIAVRAIGTPSNGFVAYYTPARLLLEGADAERFYDDEWFREQVKRFEPTVSDIYGAHPPTMPLLLLPVAWMDYHTARGVWIVGSLCLLLAAVAWLIPRLGIGGLWAPALLSIILLSTPVRDDLAHGQTYMLMLALLMAAWHGYRTTRPSMEGAPLGIILTTKNAALPFWPLLVIERRWRTLAWGIGTTLTLVLISLPLTGLPAWRRYVVEAAALLQDPRFAATAYQTQFGFFHHLFGAGGTRFGDPWMSHPLLADIMSVSCGAVLLGLTLRTAHRSGASDAMFAACVLLGLVLSPVSGDSHFTMAALPFGILVAQARDRGFPKLPTTLLFVGMFLIAANLPYLSDMVKDGALALFAYPKLYGALLLWGLALAWSGTRDRANARSVCQNAFPTTLYVGIKAETVGVAIMERPSSPPSPTPPR